MPIPFILATENATDDIDDAVAHFPHLAHHVRATMCYGDRPSP